MFFSQQFIKKKPAKELVQEQETPDDNIAEKYVNKGLGAFVHTVSMMGDNLA
jgi:hypothetical protein